MGIYRVLVDQFYTDSLPRDHTANVLHFNAVSMDTAELQDLAADVAAAFDAVGELSNAGFITKVYQLEQPKPRQILATTTIAAAAAQSTRGNRDVALCLSFFAGRNLPRQRGRIYIGPFTAASAGAYRPSAGLITQIASLPAALAGAGPAQCHWGVYSPTTNTCPTVTDWWIDNEWDTQRRRGLKPDARTVGTVSA